ncbi:hypothetical protein DSCO28_03240 [Desulfosarcina ovata subsp. sediminis]|uniref:Uncharacterized protein n=1 Tax=Desulfosarcina ovata subsp. sediminis TaxID=885957 RepID=A0A5K7ZC67_9BACT|nr:hypothetical protein DSCO28_03240 [Desulfosarcina ovata subsp. sediminis]
MTLNINNIVPEHVNAVLTAGLFSQYINQRLSTKPDRFSIGSGRDVITLLSQQLKLTILVSSSLAGRPDTVFY